METDNNISPIEIFSGSYLDAELIKSLLEDSEIESYLLDENTGVLAPWYTAAGGAGAVRLVVSNLDFEKAKAIVDGFEKSRNLE